AVATATSLDGHLAAAASGKGARDRRSWVVRPDPLPFEAGLRYRFLAMGRGRRQQTAWYSVFPAHWDDEGGRLVVNSPAGDTGLADRLIPGSLAWLIAEAGPLRVRFAVRLEAKEHVVGFGERFDALDQRGRQLDAVVFEQSNRQGPRTYLRMPVAIVTGDEGWGFHVVTSRRTWFDVGKTKPDELWIEVGLEPVVRSADFTMYLVPSEQVDVLIPYYR